MTGEPDGPRLELGFAGTPEFAATILHRLIDAGRPPRVVYTQPDRPAGRGRRLESSPVKLLARQYGLPVRQPPSLKAAGEADSLAQWGLDVLVVAAYGLLLPPAILAVPRLGCMNVHASLLPRWRGAAPVERAIIAGDAETGVSIMQMDAGLDTGPVYLQRRCAITPATDGSGLEARLAELGATALLECLDGLPGLTATPQPETGATYAPKLGRADARIDWSRPARELERRVRALRGRLPAFCEAGEIRITVLESTVVEGDPVQSPGTVLSAGPSGIAVACGEDALNLVRIRLNVGKGRPLSSGDAVNGYPRLFAAGAPIGSRAAQS